MPTRYTFQQFKREYPDNDACLAKIMELRYGSRPFCQECKRESKFHRIGKRRAYACQFCGAHLYPCVGTPFEKSTTPLHHWFFAMYLFTTTRHGVAAKELERQLGVTYKCAWRIAHEIRKLMADMQTGGLWGPRRSRRTYIGGVKKGQFWRNSATGKTVVLGLKQREGAVQTHIVDDVKRRTLEPIIHQQVRPGSVIHTDEWSAYRMLNRQGYGHQTVNHGAKEWVKNGSHTNNLEGYWSHIKRSILGTHIHVSKKYMPLYLAEFNFRHNTRTMPAQMFQVLMGLLRPAPLA